jgi:hypothetical protein
MKKKKKKLNLTSTSWSQLGCFNKSIYKLTLASTANEANLARVIIKKKKPKKCNLLLTPGALSVLNYFLKNTSNLASRALAPSDQWLDHSNLSGKKKFCKKK